MPIEANLIGRLKDELGDNPVVSNVVLAFLLAGVEKMLEVEFTCPCDPEWSTWSVVPFFVIPAVTASLLMLLIHGVSKKKTNNKNTHENNKEKESKIKNKIQNIIKNIVKIFLFSGLPLIVWMALMLLNGDYYVCGYSDWPGRFVTADKSSLKWCEPTNTTSYPSGELLTHSYKLYIWSQWYGNVMVGVLLFFLIVYIICKTMSKCCKKNNKEEAVAAMPLQDRKQDKAQQTCECSV
ncbi:calcium homeostasis modulator protein 6-like [Scomber scombrus]|uniref:Calcium homeostasis modulator protein 6-like n=1 Tax=Scomber scombrus TaxID=13677 RepID=A0AAV1NQ17_SCOSC